jgi:tetraacyldisaccharide 4'-kinase
MERDLEVVVMDSKRMLGNGLCFPAGPLREPPERLNSVDMVVFNGEPAKDSPDYHPMNFVMKLIPDTWFRPDQPQTYEVDQTPFEGKLVHAVAGIGNPKRFFDTLRTLGFEVIEHPFADHHAYRPEDFEFAEPLPILMTEKDAVKCHEFWPKRGWALSVRSGLEEDFYTCFLNRIQAIKEHLQP